MYTISVANTFSSDRKHTCHCWGCSECKGGSPPKTQKEKNKKEEGRLQGNVYYLSENTCMKLLQFLSHGPRPVMVTKLCQYITFKDRESEKNSVYFTMLLTLNLQWPLFVCCFPLFTVKTPGLRVHSKISITVCLSTSAWLYKIAWELISHICKG